MLVRLDGGRGRSGPVAAHDGRDGKVCGPGALDGRRVGGRDDARHCHQGCPGAGGVHVGGGRFHHRSKQHHQNKRLPHQLTTVS